MIALVTGGSGALGGAICRALAATHHVVAGCFRHPERAEVLTAELRAQGHAAEALAFDVRDARAIQAAVDGIVQRLGGLDCLVNSAGCSHDGLLASLAPEDLVETHTVNVLGTLFCIRAAIPSLMQGDCARIVNLSSAVAHRATAGIAAYAATKGAVEALTRALAVELGPKHITVNAVSPGYVEGGLGRGPLERVGAYVRDLVPTGRAATPEDVAQVVTFLASPAAAYVNGVVLPVDGGLLAGSRFRSAVARTTIPPGARGQR